MSLFVIIIIYPLTARVVGAPQMISHQFPPFSPVLHCPLGLGELQACPFPDVVFPPFPQSASSSSPFHCALQESLGQTNERETWPYHCSLRLFTIVRRSSCGPIVCWILAQTSSLVTWSLYEMRSTSFPWLVFFFGALREGPRFTSIQEDRCDKGTHQSYLGADRKFLSIQTGFNLVNAAVVCAIVESKSGLEPSSVITEPKQASSLTHSTHKLSKPLTHIHSSTVDHPPLVID